MCFCPSRSLWKASTCFFHGLTVCASAPERRSNPKDLRNTDFSGRRKMGTYCDVLWGVASEFQLAGRSLVHNGDRMVPSVSRSENARPLQAEHQCARTTRETRPRLGSNQY